MWICSAQFCCTLSEYRAIPEHQPAWPPIKVAHSSRNALANSASIFPLSWRFPWMPWLRLGRGWGLLLPPFPSTDLLEGGERLLPAAGRLHGGGQLWGRVTADHRDVRVRELPLDRFEPRFLKGTISLVRSDWLERRVEMEGTINS